MPTLFEREWNNFSPDQQIKVLTEQVNELITPEIEIVKKLIAGKDPTDEWVQLLFNPLITRFPYKFSPSRHILDGKGNPFLLQLTYTSTQEGLIDIGTTIQTETSERTWIHLPTLGLWIDDSYERDIESVSGDAPLRHALANLVSEINLIHTHPDKSLRDLFVQKKRAADYLLHGALPTTGDLIGLTLMVANGNRSCRWVENVVSHYGVSSFEMTPDNLIYGTGASGSYLGQDVDMNRYPIQEIKRIALGQQMQNLIETLRFDGIISPAFFITFKSFEEIAGR